MSIGNNSGRIFGGILGIIIILALASTAMADIELEYLGAQGFTSNLFNDSLEIGDRSTSNKIKVSFYPLSSIRIVAKGTYTLYGVTSGLGNFAASVDATFIPTSENALFSLYINGNIRPTSYKKAFESQDNNAYNLNLGLSYQISKLAQIRGGGSFTSNQYTNDPELGYDTTSLPPLFLIPADHKIYELFVGGNITLLGSNSLDIEIGYSRIDFASIKPPEGTRDYLNPFMDSLQEGNVGAFYFSPRFSRSIGSKTGLNLTYIYRKFEKNDDKIIPGQSTSFLSPWASVYDGHAITLSVKTFFIPNHIMNFGIGYWKKNYFKQETERGIPLKAPYVIDRRRDELYKVFFSAKKPFSTKSGYYFEPAVQFDFSGNKSNLNLYDFDIISVALGITVRK